MRALWYRSKSWFYMGVCFVLGWFIHPHVEVGELVKLRRKIATDVTKESKFWFRISTLSYRIGRQHAHWKYVVITYEVNPCERSALPPEGREHYKQHRWYYGLSVPEFSLLVTHDFPYITGMQYDAPPSK
jgi:hypothetical protein